jgi:transitional endoplasmic reticulum ATPase
MSTELGECHFQGIFFATTNLMDQLDVASLRRFDAKINFGFLKFEQCKMLFDKMCEQLSVDSNELAYVSLRFLDKLTPGDFTNVLRQSRLRPIRNSSELIDRLAQEMSMKKLVGGRPMGFLAQAA